MGRGGSAGRGGGGGGGGGALAPWKGPGGNSPDEVKLRKLAARLGFEHVLAIPAPRFFPEEGVTYQAVWKTDPKVAYQTVSGKTLAEMRPKMIAVAKVKGVYPTYQLRYDSSPTTWPKGYPARIRRENLYDSDDYR